VVTTDWNTLMMVIEVATAETCWVTLVVAVESAGGPFWSCVIEAVVPESSGGRETSAMVVVLAVGGQVLTREVGAGGT